MIRNVLVLGAGTAGLIAALTLKRRIPDLTVRVLRSPEIGIIGVGEGTTAVFPRFLFEYLRLPVGEFYREAQPTWKLGIRFLWGDRPDFYYTFAHEFTQRAPGLARNVGFYCEEESRIAGPISALMSEDKAFPRRPDGLPVLHRNHAFHIENRKLVAYLEARCREAGTEIVDGTVQSVAMKEGIVDYLVLDDGRTMTGDLFVDASGFRSELLGKAIGEEFISFSKALFCDRAVVGGWSRTSEQIKPYTIAETMDAGWCWQIDHEHWINRGYVYSSAFISDDAALQEFLRKNPTVENEPRVVRFRSGCYARNWVGNVVGVGNAVGFVEPLEATAIQVICVEATTLADSLADCLGEPTPSLITLYNRYNRQDWDEIRDFLAVHYAFNTRLDTPFWQACRAQTDLGSAAEIVDFYQQNGPSLLAGPALLRATESFGLDGYLAMLVGQKVPHGKPWSAPPAERQAWERHRAGWVTQARAGLTVQESLDALRKANWPGL